MPQSPLERQRAMAQHAYTVARRFSQLEHSVLGAAVFVGASHKPHDERAHPIVERSAALVARMARQMQEYRSALDTEWQALRTALRAEQLAAFQRDFCIAEAAAPLAAPTDDPLCCGAATHAMRCCGAAICGDCALQHSFESSACGTELSAACPFCRARYNVYAAPRRPLRRSPRRTPA